MSDLDNFDDRSIQIFRKLVDTYLTTGEPVGSRNLSKYLPMTLSPASVRNVMADLEDLGLIYAPHTSAGRMPTESGLRLFVDGLMEVGELEDSERREIERRITSDSVDKSVEDLLSEASEAISGLSACAGVVLADKKKERLKQIDFVPLETNKALMVLVGENSSVENRVLELPENLPMSALQEARNYLNAHLSGLTLGEAREKLESDQIKRKQELDELTQRIVETGFAQWSGEEGDARNLIVRGRSQLLSDVNATDDLKVVRRLFDDLENKRDLIEVLSLAERAEGVRIFIGSENQLFSLSGSSIVVSPFKDQDNRIVGVLGVIGPTRLNYGRIIPMVDYTAKLVSKLIS